MELKQVVSFLEDKQKNGELSPDLNFSMGPGDQIQVRRNSGNNTINIIKKPGKPYYFPGIDEIDFWDVKFSYYMYRLIHLEPQDPDNICSWIYETLKKGVTGSRDYGRAATGVFDCYHDLREKTRFMESKLKGEYKEYTKILGDKGFKYYFNSLDPYIKSYKTIYSYLDPLGGDEGVYDAKIIIVGLHIPIPGASPNLSKDGKGPVLAIQMRKYPDGVIRPYYSLMELVDDPAHSYPMSRTITMDFKFESIKKSISTYITTRVVNDIDLFGKGFSEEDEAHLLEILEFLE